MNGSLPPTAARLREFRERGDLARSRDAVAAATLLGAVLALLLTAPRSWSRLCGLAAAALRDASVEGANRLAGPALWVAVSVTAPVLLGALLAALLAIALQLGWPPLLRWGRGNDPRNPRGLAAGLQQAFGLAGMARRSVAAVAKLTAVGAVLAFALQPAQALRVGNAQQLLEGLTACCGTALVASALAFVAIGALDYLIARWRLATRLKMTPAELRREQRDQEGDPAIKARRQRRRQQLMRRGRRAAAAAPSGGAP